MFQNLALMSLAALASASPEFQLRPWQAPGPGDSRGPCPMMNTLANHGYLPHNGRNLTLQHFADAVVEALNTQELYGTKPAQIFIKGIGRDYFDLEELNRPGILQHIASLTREDLTDQGSTDGLVSRQRVDDLIGESPTNYVTATSMARSRLRVEALSSPDELTPAETLMAYVESSLVLMMMSEEPVPSAWTLPGTETWKAPKERVRIWLTEERLPEELGWQRSERTLKVVDLFPIMKAIFDEKRRVSGKRPLWKAWIPSYFTGDGRDEL